MPPPVCSSDPPPLRLLAAWRERLMLSRSVAYAVLARVWQFLAGAVSLLVIARTLSPELQGFYYGFGSLLAIQIFFDLGLTGVLIYVASHEWGAAQSEDPAARQRARSRLGELFLRSQRWYAICAGAFMLIAVGAGLWFFRREAPSDLSWRLPWVTSVVFTAASLWLSPAVVILEGCNFVAQVQLLRLVQAVLGNLVVWGTLLAGGELWAVAASALVRLITDAFLVFWQHRSFIREMIAAARAGDAALSWKGELLPLQWRIAVQSIASYFLYQLYTPIIFLYYGAAAAGRMGMTWSVLSTLQLVAYAWIQTSVPQLGRLIAEVPGQARGFFRRVVAVSLGVYAAGSVAIMLVVLGLERWLPSLAERLLEPGTVLLFAIALGLTLTVSGLATYVRAHKIDPFLGIGIVHAIVTGGLMWWWGARFGPAGAAAANIVTNACLMLPATFVIYRNTVQRESSGDKESPSESASGGGP